MSLNSNLSKFEYDMTDDEIDDEIALNSNLSKFESDLEYLYPIPL